LSFVVLLSVYKEVTNGLQAASTVPFAIPISKVEINNAQYGLPKLPAKIVSRMPAKWNINAITSNFFIPIISTIIPPIITASGKPQKAVAVMVDISDLSKLNCVPHVPNKPALMPNESEVTSNARQLATNSLFRFIACISCFK